MGNLLYSTMSSCQMNMVLFIMLDSGTDLPVDDRGTHNLTAGTFVHFYWSTMF